MTVNWDRFEEKGRHALSRVVDLVVECLVSVLFYSSSFILPVVGCGCSS